MEPGSGSGSKGAMGLLLIAGGIVLVYIVIRDLTSGSNGYNTPGYSVPGQSNILGQLFGIPYAGGQAPPPVSGPATKPADSHGSCPSGYYNVSGTCYKIVAIAD